MSERASERASECYETRKLKVHNDRKKCYKKADGLDLI